MRKLVITSLVLVFATTGCFNKNTEPTNKVAVPEGASKEYAKLIDWFNSGKAVECVIHAEEGDTTTYSKGDKVYMEGLGFNPQNPSEAGYMINDGEWTYIWSGKTGTKMNIKKMDEMDMDEEEEFEDDGDWQTEVESWDDMGFAYDCKEANFGDEKFKAPDDVEFTDMTAMLEDMNNMSNEFGEKYGDAENMSAEDMEDMQADLEKMMEGMGDMNFGQ